MTCELAKQLKDAGFPGEIVMGQSTDGLPPIVIAPTLEELIEACGEDFYSLQKIGDSFVVMPAFPAKISDSKIWKTLCPSAREAVAHLWLALNTK